MHPAKLGGAGTSTEKACDGRATKEESDPPSGGYCASQAGSLAMGKSAKSSAASAADGKKKSAPKKVILCRIDGCGQPVGRECVNVRYRICQTCIKSPHIFHEGIEQRFCQQCSRLQPVEDFGANKKSCRESLWRIGKRRRDRLALEEEEEIRQAKRANASPGDLESPEVLAQRIRAALMPAESPLEVLESGNLSFTPPSQRSMPTQADFLRLLTLHASAGSSAASDAETPTSPERNCPFPSTPTSAAVSGPSSPADTSRSDCTQLHRPISLPPKRVQNPSRLGVSPAGHAAQPPSAAGTIGSLGSGRSVIVRGQLPVDSSQQTPPDDGPTGAPPPAAPGHALKRQASTPQEWQHFSSFLDELYPTQLEAPQAEEPEQPEVQFPVGTIQTHSPAPDGTTLLRQDSLSALLPSPASIERFGLPPPPW